MIKMDEATLLQFVLQALLMILMLSLPPILAAAIFGVTVAIFQAVTQIQEQVLAFSIKLIAVIITIVFTARWAGMEMYRFSVLLFDGFPGIVS